MARTVLVFLVFLVAGFAISAEKTPQFAAYQNYSPPIQTNVSFDTVQLRWLNQVFDLMGSKDFTFVYRTDTNHWIGLYRERLSMVIHIHNESASFNFRARVDRTTGAIEVLRGVAYLGMKKSESAHTAARLATGYLHRVLTNKDIFGTKTTSMTVSKDDPKNQKTIPKTSSRTSSKTSPAPAVHEGPIVHPESNMPHEPARPMSHKGTMPEDSLSKLLTGNSRFVSGHQQHPNQNPERRELVAEGQHPFAIVVACSDSRLSPELVFDQGLGDIFVVRTAGHVVGDYELGSIEYAVEHLQAQYILVLGHERCGAVEATIQKGEFSDNITRITMQIKPAVDAAKGMSGNLLDNAIRQHAKNTLAKIRMSAVVEELMHEKKVSLNAAYFDLDSGAVSILE